MQTVSSICRRVFLTDLSFSSATGAGAHPDLASGGHRTGACGRHGESSVTEATPCRDRYLPAEYEYLLL